MLSFRIERFSLVAAVVMCLTTQGQAQDSTAGRARASAAAPMPMYGGYGAAPYYGATTWDYGYPSGYAMQPGAYANSTTTANGGTAGATMAPGTSTVPNSGPTYYPGPVYGAYGAPGCGPAYSGCDSPCEPHHCCCLGRLFRRLCSWRHRCGGDDCGPCGHPAPACGPSGCGPYGY